MKLTISSDEKFSLLFTVFELSPTVISPFIPISGCLHFRDSPCDRGDVKHHGPVVQS